VLILAFLPAFFDLSGALRWALVILMLVLSLGIAVWAQSSIGKICASLLAAIQQGHAEDEKRGQEILDLNEKCRQMELERKNAAEERREHELLLADEQARAAAAVQQADGLKQEKERLLAEHRRAGEELTEAVDRRRLSETRNHDL